MRDIDFALEDGEFAVASRRGKRKTFRLGLNRGNREYFREKISVLGLGLENRLSEKVQFLSGGQRQSLTLIMASLVAPRLMLLDEHCSALDPRAAELVLRLTSEVVTGEAITTVMVTHNMQHALQFGGRLFMMHEGQIVLDAAAAEKSGLSRERPGRAVPRHRRQDAAGLTVPVWASSTCTSTCSR